MKTIGLLGGMSWESSASYYQLINEGVKEALGGLHSAKIVLYSVDFQEIETLQHQGEWDKTATLLANAAQQIESAGADFLLICTNTMHRVASLVEEQISIPLLHIADATAEEIVAAGIQKVGLLGTRFTMEQDFYKGRLTDKYGLGVLIPAATDRELIHQVIYDELCLGEINDSSRQAYKQIIKKLMDQGADGIILGCTEIALLVKPEDLPEVRLFDTTEIHAKKAVQWAL